MPEIQETIRYGNGKPDHHPQRYNPISKVREKIKHAMYWNSPESWGNRFVDSYDRIIAVLPEDKQETINTKIRPIIVKSAPAVGWGVIGTEVALLGLGVGYGAYKTHTIEKGTHVFQHMRQNVDIQKRFTNKKEQGKRLLQNARTKLALLAASLTVAAKGAHESRKHPLEPPDSPVEHALSKEELEERETSKVFEFMKRLREEPDPKHIQVDDKTIEALVSLAAKDDGMVLSLWFLYEKDSLPTNIANRLIGIFLNDKYVRDNLLTKLKFGELSSNQLNAIVSYLQQPSTKDDVNNRLQISTAAAYYIEYSGYRMEHQTSKKSESQTDIITDLCIKAGHIDGVSSWNICRAVQFHVNQETSKKNLSDDDCMRLVQFMAKFVQDDDPEVQQNAVFTIQAALSSKMLENNHDLIKSLYSTLIHAHTLRTQMALSEQLKYNKKGSPGYIPSQLQHAAIDAIVMSVPDTSDDEEMRLIVEIRDNVSHSMNKIPITKIPKVLAFLRKTKPYVDKYERTIEERWQM